MAYFWSAGDHITAARLNQPVPAVENAISVSTHNILELAHEDYYRGSVEFWDSLFFDGFSDSLKTNVLSDAVIEEANHRLMLPGPIRTAKSLTANGAVQVDTAQKKFGTGSALFDGSGDYITIPDSSDWDIFDGNDYSVDLWIRLSTITPGTNGAFAILGQDQNASNYNGFIWVPNGGSSQLGVRCQVGGGGSEVNLQYVGSAANFSANTWYHIGFARQSGTNYMFIDGVSLTLTTNTWTNASHVSGLMQIGRNVSAVWDDFPGWMDEIRISKGTNLLGTTSFTPATSAYTASASDVLLVHADGTDGAQTFTDDVYGASSGFYQSIITTFQKARTAVFLWVKRNVYRLNLENAIAVSDDSLLVTQTGLGGFAINDTIDIYDENNFVRERKTVTDFQPVVAQKSFQVDTGLSLTTSLLGYYKLEEASGTRFDFYNGYDLTDNNTVGQVAGKVNYGANFVRANSEYLSAATTSVYDGFNDFSISFWVKTASSESANCQLVSKHDALVSGYGFNIDLNGNGGAGKVGFEVGMATGYKVIKNTTSVNDGNWHHIIVTRTTGTLKIYHNGSDETTAVSGSGSINGAVTLAHYFRVGANNNPAAYLNGYLDEIGVWEKVLSTQEIADLYNSGSGQTMISGQKSFQIDTSLTLNTNLVAYWKLDELTGTRSDYYATHNLLLGTEPGYVTGKISNAADFTSGSSEYLTAGNDPAFDANNSFSVSFWIKTTTTSAGYILSKYVGTPKGWLLALNGTTTGKISAYLTDGTNNLSKRCSTSVNTGNWVHVIFVYDKAGNTANFYIDGGSAESVEDGASSGTVGDMSNSTAFEMGRNAAGSSYITAAIDETAFWNKVLSSQERLDLYNGGAGQTMTSGSRVIEDFTTYTEVDTPGRLTVTSTRVTVTNGDRDEIYYCYSDKGTGHFSGDYEHWFTTLVDTDPTYYAGNIYSLTNNLGGYEDFTDAISVNIAKGANTIDLVETDGGTQYASVGPTLSDNTPYYCKVIRNENVGTYGTVYLYVYSDVARTIQVGTTISVALHTSKKDFRYVEVMAGYNDGVTGRDWNGYIENLSLTSSTILPSTYEITFTPAVINPTGFDTNAWVERVSVKPQVSLVDTPAIYDNTRLPVQKTMTARGNGQVDTAQQKFGTGSLVVAASSSDAIDTPDHSDWTFAGNDFTVEFWMRFDTTVPTSTKLLVCHRTDPTNRGWDIAYNGSATPGNRAINVEYSTDGSAVTQVVCPWNPSADTWYHIAVSRNGANLYAFVDGTQIGTTHNIGASVIYNSTAILSIGNMSGIGDTISGWFDEIRISDKARYTTTFTAPTAEFVPDDNTVLLLHCNGTDGSTTFIDDIGGTVDNQVWQDMDYVESTVLQTGNVKSMNFVRTASEYLKITDANQTGLDIVGDISVEAWVKLSALPSTPALTYCIASKWVTGDRAWFFEIISPSNKLRFAYYDASTNSTLADEKESSFDSTNVGQWIHVAATANVSQKTIRLYVNGKERETVYTGTNATSIKNATCDLNVGARSNGTEEFFDGYIDEVRIWDKARTGADINHTFRKQITAQTNLVAYWKLNDDLLDSSGNSNTLVVGGTPTYSSDIPFSDEVEDKYTLTTAAKNDFSVKLLLDRVDGSQEVSARQLGTYIAE